MVRVSAEVLNSSRPPYTPGQSREAVAARFGLAIEDVAKLGSAENPFGPSPKAAAAVDAARSRIDNYPDWSSRALREAIGAKYGFDPDCVVCGSGETEVISLVLRAYSRPGDRILMFAPCFPVYHIFTEQEGRVPLFVPLASATDFDFDRYLEALRAERPAIAFVTNPHSPTGRLPSEADIRRVAEAAAGTDTLVVLDEAYIHFTETPGHMALTRDYPHLIVLRTFSKAFGLAGLRLGFGVAANAGLVTPLRNIKPTWNLGWMQTAGGIAALDDDAHVARTVAMVVEMRAYTAQALAGLNRFRMVDGSRSNFFLVEILDPELTSTTVFERLLEKGVIVKDCSIDFVGLGDRFLRVDVGVKKDMDRFIGALRGLDRNW
ncbi:histidinol-phosphate aminotransferase [Allostella sp. ATCC 35155]|nr:histidinol-phosphate aminotransferase [Stella sp. ATCC 35155]